MTLDELEKAIVEVKGRTDQPFGVNLRADAADAAGPLRPADRVRREGRVVRPGPQAGADRQAQGARHRRDPVDRRRQARREGRRLGRRRRDGAGRRGRRPHRSACRPRCCCPTGARRRRHPGRRRRRLLRRSRPRRRAVVRRRRGRHGHPLPADPRLRRSPTPSSSSTSSAASPTPSSPRRSTACRTGCCAPTWSRSSRRPAPSSGWGRPLRRTLAFKRTQRDVLARPGQGRPGDEAGSGPLARPRWRSPPTPR